MIFLILDNLETILDNNQNFIEPELGKWFNELIAHTPKFSRILVTCRYYFNFFHENRELVKNQWIHLMVYQKQQNWDKAFKNYKKAIKWNEKIEKHVQLNLTYHNIGMVYEQTKNYKKAFKAFIKALNFSKKFNKTYETDVITKSLKRIEPHLNSQEIKLLKNIISKTT